MQQTSAKEYNTRYDWVRKVIYWELWKRVKFAMWTNAKCTNQNETQ